VSPDIMQKIVLQSLLTTLLSVIGSVLAAASVVPALGGSLDGNGLLMCILCPIVVAGPASAYTFWQRDRLKIAHDALEEAHRQLARTHAELLEKSRHDFQTGFLNRESFLDELAGQGEIGGGSLLIIDADHFKRINDRYGHLVGDEALREIAAAIGRAVRAGDIVGRIGGEEFGGILIGAGGDEAIAIAERVRREVEQLKFFPQQGVMLPLTISIGGAELRRGASVSDHMRAADARLYAAKKGGRNCSVFDLDAKVAA
jgi:diguanylate cyclase (GGDEF)-like protein